MAESNFSRRLHKEVLIVAYAMSRLDAAYLQHRGFNSWKAAFQEVAEALEVAPNNLRLLRDEFDPIHANPRKGWHFREMRPTRQAVVDEFEGLSDAALEAFVDELLQMAETPSELALPETPGSSKSNVAERLQTGRLAEAYFLDNCSDIFDVEQSEIVDLRHAALGFDFGVAGRPAQAIEVKGMKTFRGEILFTDREWAEATRRRANYHLVVVGNLASAPSHQVFQDPYSLLSPRCVYQRTLTASWRSRVELVAPL